MKHAQVSQICEANDNFNIDWKKTIISPLVVGFAFGIGYYLATVFLKTNIMSDLIDEAKQKKIRTISRLSAAKVK